MRWGLLLVALAAACARGEVVPEERVAVVEMTAPILPLVEVAEAIRRAAARVGAPLAEGERALLRHIYEEGGDLPVWLTPWGGLRDIANDALALLRASADEGLRPQDYDIARLDSLGARIETGGPPVVSEIAHFETGLTLAIGRYLTHLHEGRVDPRRIGFPFQAETERHHLPSLLANALNAGSLLEVARDLAPAFPQYALLKRSLPRYRALAAEPEEPIPDIEMLRTGDSTMVIASVARRLARLGDLAAYPAGDTVRIDSAFVAGVRRFQVRHGLEPDGVLGRETLAELRVPLDWRVHQMELALERLRWIPDLGGGPLVLVNIPMFELTAWDSVTPAAVPAMRTGVIVGKALDTRTPILFEEMRYVVFRPYWNVPRSITRNEILPEIQADPEYLRKQGMEIVQGLGDSPAVLVQSPENLALLAAGQLRVRQRPGPANSLGLVKFIFPNDENVYLHGTPAPQLFDRARRDFSHGCVRVEQPERLAEFVLRDQPAWTRDRIDASMQGASPQRVDLRAPLRVLLFYSTASAAPDGTVRFARDIYGHDERLDAALHGGEGR